MQQLIQVEPENEVHVPICGGNFVTPVVEPQLYTEEFRYRIGDREYIENAD